MDDGVALEVAVEGDGPGLLLVHGSSGAKEDFADHVPALARDHTVVVFDLRGHGASDKPAERAAYTLDRLAADTLQVADAVGLDQFRLLGYSMGGMAVRKVAIDAPERVSALVMMDTCAGPIPDWDPSLLELAADVAFEQGKDALKELLDFAAALETPAYRRLLAERPGYQAYGDRKWADTSEIMWGAMALEIAYQPDHLPAMSTLRCPVLVIVGEQDTSFLAPSQHMVDAIPGAQLAVIADAGHSPQFENPPAWFDALSTFLAALPTPAR
jgi:pimeloyl-ACP methyl ester carboxylesterase